MPYGSLDGLKADLYKDYGRLRYVNPAKLRLVSISGLKSQSALNLLMFPMCAFIVRVTFEVVYVPRTTFWLLGT